MPSPSSQPSVEHALLLEGQKPFAGKYTIERVIGQGGMGTVFEARHLRLDQRVAIKILGSALCGHPELVQRFEREARAAGSLSSAHAVRIFDIDNEDGTPFMVMELLSGRDLSQILEAEGPQPVARSVRWVVEAADAIAEAHRLGIIHRDLKPSNLFLSTTVEGGTLVKVLDFGIAKRVTSNDASITHALSPLGTPQYMSPEQVRCAKGVDARTDIWSLGVTLYELVTGTTPFPDPSASACIAAIAADPVPDPRTVRADLGDELVSVLMRALAKNPDDRYQSISELVSALEPFMGEVDANESISAARRAVQIADATIADEPLVPGTSYSLRAFKPRAPLESGSDRTIPPSVSMPPDAPRRRIRPAVAFASASAIGAAALLLVGLFHAPHEAQGIPSTAALLPPSTMVEAPPPPAAPPAVEPIAVVDEPVAPTPAVEPDAAPLPAPLARPVFTPKPLPTRPLVAALGYGPGEARHPFAPKTPRPAKQPTASRTIHGGLTNPGF